MINNTKYQNRIKVLNNGVSNPEADYVLYWMQASQRTLFNHALEYSIEIANELRKPLLVCFGITPDFPGAIARHYEFMLEGLACLEKNLKERNIPFYIAFEHPVEMAVRLSDKAAVLVTDRGYLRIQKEWREKVGERIKIPFYQVETDIVVPVEIASVKEEYSARTLRPKIHRLLDEYLQQIKLNELQIPVTELNFALDKKIDLSDIPSLITKLKVKGDSNYHKKYIGGENQALELLGLFIKEKAEKYPDRNNPGEELTSNLSPYLHFGNISPLLIALMVNNSDINQEAKKTFLEELIVRRELAINFCHFNANYDKYESITYDWAYKTLDLHSKDKREFLYSTEELENAETHDKYWNAAQKEMLITGKMNGYMRMYWGKKLIEWSSSPDEAYSRLLYLNDKYEIDGRDPNGYCGIAWCFGKHDRAWSERSIFGKIRYMNAEGLKRKFDMEKYIERVKKLDKEFFPKSDARNNSFG